MGRDYRTLKTQGTERFSLPSCNFARINQRFSPTAVGAMGAVNVVSRVGDEKRTVPSVASTSNVY